MAQDLLTSIKKNCRACCGYRMFKPNDTSYRSAVVRDLDALQREFTQQFDTLRRQADTADTAVRTAKDNKYFYMDLIATCQKCDREIDRVNRAVGPLKKTAPFE